MIIKPSIRNNLFTNSHPVGCEKNVLTQIKRSQELGKFDGPKNVLVVGGSSGYGLATRIALATGCESNTINVSFESGPKGKRSGTAGYWNNAAFQKYFQSSTMIHKDFLGDAFSKKMKDDVANYIKETFGKIDLLVYSVASGARKNEETDQLVYSSIKSLGKDVVGKTIDIVSGDIYELTVTNADEQEIKDTVYVMGGSDWENWVKTMADYGLLNPGFKTISYTYIGGETTKSIYRDGTLGKAKEDLEETASRMNVTLQNELNGEALISSSKAVATKASIYIPQMPIYVAALYDTMIKDGSHESILEHKHRLFKDMVYGNSRILDEKSRIRLDHFEMDEDIQSKTKDLMDSITQENIHSLLGTKVFIKELFNLNGFRNDEIDYEKDIDLEELNRNYKFTRI